MASVCDADGPLIEPCNVIGPLIEPCNVRMISDEVNTSKQKQTEHAHKDLNMCTKQAA